MGDINAWRNSRLADMAGIIASAVGLCYCQNGSLVRWIRLAVHVSNQFGLIPTKARMLERRFKAGDAPLHGAKAPSIELADKASEDNATEVLRQDFRRELVGIVDGEGLAIGQPADDGDIAGIGKDLQEDLREVLGSFVARDFVEGFGSSRRWLRLLLRR